MFRASETSRVSRPELGGLQIKTKTLKLLIALELGFRVQGLGFGV